MGASPPADATSTAGSPLDAATAVPDGAAHAAALDAADPLAGYRRRFVDAEPALIYLDGNSLGRLPVDALPLARDLVERQWGQRLIRGWNEGWFDAPERIGAKVARLIGAQAEEVILADSTSVNLFKLVVAALRLRRGRPRILTDNLNFPSDLYVLHGAAGLLEAGHSVLVVPSPDEVHGPEAELRAALDERTALLALSHTAFKSGYTYDLPGLTAVAHAAGALVLWDLSHSVGAMPIDLAAAGVDLAVGCTYKYLNGGPGAPAFLYVRRELQESLENPITGWMGRDQVFDFGPQYRPATGIRRFLTGTPPVLSLALIEPGLDLLLEAGLEAVRRKSVAQTNYLIALWEALLAPLGFSLRSPRVAERRGSHVALGHAQALAIDLALIEELQVIPDFRPPDTIRLGLAPLYNTFAEIQAAVERLRAAVIERRYERYAERLPDVT